MTIETMAAKSSRRPWRDNQYHFYIILTNNYCIMTIWWCQLKAGYSHDTVNDVNFSVTSTEKWMAYIPLGQALADKNRTLT